MPKRVRTPAAPAAVPVAQPQRPAAAPPLLAGEALMLRVVDLARERRAEDVVALDVRGLADYMDYLVLATGRSPRQNRSIADGVMRGLKGLKVRPLARPDGQDGPWMCLDFVDVVFHVFDGATRAFYDLELLWSDAKPVALPEPKPFVDPDVAAAAAEAEAAAAAAAAQAEAAPPAKAKRRKRAPAKPKPRT